VKIEKADRETPFGSLRTLTVEGVDHAGIVYNVSRYLAKNGINIIDLRSRLDRSPESGAPFYSLVMQIEIPDGYALDALEDGFSIIENELHVDIQLT